MSDKRGFFDVIPVVFGEISIPKVGKIEIPMPQWFKGYLLKIQNYLKYMSLANLNIPNKSIPLAKIDMGEIHFPLCLPASNFTTTKTAGDNIGGYFLWHPNNFPSGGKWYLEASLAISNANGTATLTLKGSSDVKELTTKSTAMVNVREPVDMPASGQTLYLNLKTSSASYTAALGGVRLIMVT